MSTVYQAAVLADSPSVYYRLGDSASPAVPDSGAGGVNLTVSGSVSFGQTGAFAGDTNTCVSFPGTASNYLQTATSPGSAYDLGDGSFSIEFWFKNNAAPAANQDLLGKQGTNCYVVRMDSSGHLILNCSGVGNCFVTTNTWTDTTTWHHVVITRVAATQPHIWVDNSDQAGTYTARTFSNSTSQFDLARSGTANYYNGKLQDVALYKSVLSSTRVGVHYNAGINAINGTAAVQAKKSSIDAVAVSVVSSGPRMKKMSIFASSTEASVITNGPRMKKMRILISTASLPTILAGPRMKKMRISGVSTGITNITGTVGMKKMRTAGSAPEVSVVTGTVGMKKMHVVISSTEASVILSGPSMKKMRISATSSEASVITGAVHMKKMRVIVTAGNFSAVIGAVHTKKMRISGTSSELTSTSGVVRMKKASVSGVILGVTDITGALRMRKMSVTASSAEIAVITGLVAMKPKVHVVIDLRPVYADEVFVFTPV